MALTPYAGEEHSPFLWTGGKPAALLVHGFPGTPAEVRALAGVLHGAGWTVQGILLPGFGADIASLPERTAQAWIQATGDAVAEFARTHSPVVLVGFSMGAAVALNAAVQGETSPDGLVLLAPFTQLGADWQQPLLPLLGLIFREIRPFKDADFSDAEVRRNIANFLPDADLDDPKTQDELRAISLPASVLDQLRQVGQLARRRAQDLQIPTLIVQGVDDEVVSPKRTRQLAGRIDPSRLQFVEISGGHQIITPSQAGWVEASAAVRDFVTSL